MPRRGGALKREQLPEPSAAANEETERAKAVERAGHGPRIEVRWAVKNNPPREDECFSNGRLPQRGA